MSTESKPLLKTDEESKQLIIELLGGEKTGGFDVDSIYYIEDRGWVILEFLKCDTVRPFNSHPNRYWDKNKQKFLSLGRLAEHLEGELVLVNYEDSRDQFRVIEVKEMDETGITKQEKIKMDLEEFRDYFKDLNRQARGV